MFACLPGLPDSFTPSPLPVMALVAEQTYTLGRNSDNTIRIDKSQVSGHHATLTVVSENVMLLEDNDSTNGTFVNGLRIRRSLIDPTDKVALANLPLDLSKLFAKNHSAVQSNSPGSTNSDYTASFAHLKQVHASYLEARKDLQRGEKMKVWLRAGLFFVPHIGMPLGILMSGLLSSSEKMEVLDREFQLKYACPKCKRFLGSIYWETLASQKRCGCGAIWVID